jgi:hypothetical protein
VTFTVADEFTWSAYCHCSICRAATGAASKPFARARRDALGETVGEISTYGPAGKYDVRCATCSSYLYSIVEDDEFVHVLLGSLVDTPTIRPMCHIFVGSKAPWHEITDDLPQHDTLP